MRLPLRRALLALLASTGLLSSSMAPALSEPSAAAPSVRDTPTYAYGSHPRQTVTVYGAEGRPALVILHGGYWAKDTDWSGWARWFAARGFRVYEADYRLNTDAPWPAQRTDTLAALAWAARHSGTRPLLLGSSAGGHLATVAGGYGKGAARVRGVVALSPVASPLRAWTDGGRAGATSRERRLREEAGRLAGCAPTACPPQWHSLSASSYASGPDDAPLLLIHSTADFVPPAHSLDLATAARSRGLRDVTVRTEPGSAHGAALLKRAALREAVLRWLRDRTRNPLT